MVFNPLRERGLERFTDPQSPAEMLGGGSAAIASHYFQPKIGGDLAVAMGIAKRIVERADRDREPDAFNTEALDRVFIAANTHGYDVVADSVRDTGWADIERESGLSHAQLGAAFCRWWGCSPRRMGDRGNPGRAAL